MEPAAVSQILLESSLFTESRDIRLTKHFTRITNLAESQKVTLICSEDEKINCLMTYNKCSKGSNTSWP